jgi:hypothetical protein
MADKKVELKEAYIGYIDILGMTNMMLQKSDQEFQDFCNDMANVVDSVIFEDSRYYKRMKIEINFHMFSDNMIFICNDINFLIERLGLLQRRLAIMLGVIVKGGVNKGKIYMYENKFVLGKGLLYAYKIDEEYHYPAIKVSEEIISDGEYNVKNVLNDEYIIDYYQVAYSLSETDFTYEELPIIKDLIESNLKKYEGKDSKIYKKYLWMKNYHNNFCKKNNINKCIA